MDLEFHCRPTPIPGVWEVARLPFSHAVDCPHPVPFSHAVDCPHPAVGEWRAIVYPLEECLEDFFNWLYPHAELHQQNASSPRETTWHRDCGFIGCDRMLLTVLGPIGTEFRHRADDGEFREFRGEPGVVYLMENIDHRSPACCADPDYPYRHLLRWRATGDLSW